MKRVISLWGLVTKRPYLTGAVVIVILLIGWSFTRSNSVAYETLVVTPSEFVQQVSIAGKVVPAQEVEMSFSEGGRVLSLPADVGDKVVKGQTLGSLAADVLYTSLSTAKLDLERITAEQNTLVASARRKLLSTGLTAIPYDTDYTQEAPTITGAYDGPEGTYRISIDVYSINDNDYGIWTFDLERTGPIVIEEDEPTKLGTRGLYISFPDEARMYDDTVWYVTIPNVKNSSYLANYNAYQEAVSARDSAITSAQNKIDSITADIGERVLRAPFSGVVTAVDVEPGATVSANQNIISMISDDALQLESFIPEVNIADVAVGDIAKITLDAYGKAEVFEATIISIDPAETVRDGVSTYKTMLEFNTDDARIRPGMTANIDIETERKQDALVVPQGAIIRRGQDTFVRVMIDEKESEERPVVVGLTSLGKAEIIAGIQSGDTIVLNP
jgi:multidrug efflux pump subunit AcrA (membrane-fusion protein)